MKGPALRRGPVTLRVRYFLQLVAVLLLLLSFLLLVVLAFLRAHAGVAAARIAGRLLVQALGLPAVLALVLRLRLAVAQLGALELLLLLHGQLSRWRDSQSFSCFSASSLPMP